MTLADVTAPETRPPHTGTHRFGAGPAEWQSIESREDKEASRPLRLPRQSGLRRPPGGFTLVEVMMAVSILLVVVVSVTAAITAGQQHAFEAHQRIGGTLVADGRDRR